MKPFANAGTALRASLKYLSKEGHLAPSTSDPSSPGSNFGQKDRITKSVIGYNLKISNPRDRLINVPGRKANPIFAVANALWIAAGRNDLEFIQYYNERGKNFSDDGVTLYGAYGGRLASGCMINQLESGIIDRLTKDPYTRRAFGTIVQPRDTTTDSKDLPCALSIQFHRSKYGLDMITTMRSQSAAMVMPYDIFALTFLHEMLATILCMPLGIYHHDSGSFHYYMEEQEIVDEILRGRSTRIMVPRSVPVMSQTYVRGWIDRVFKLEAHIRHGTLTPSELRDETLPGYWKGILFLLGVQTWGKRDDVIMHVPAYYRKALI